MSSILKALQKLDKEKALHQDAAGINVSREILRQQPTNRKMIFWFWIAGIAALAVIATLSALLLIKPSLQSAVKSAPATLAPARDGGLQPAAGTLVPSPPASTGSKAVTAPLSATKEMKPQQLRPTLPPPQPSSAKSNRTELPDSQAPAKEPSRADDGRKPPPPGRSEHADTSLTLSGIAWNKDSADRLAIINGQAAATGTTVNGVIIEEIMPDRVKVNSAGRSFEIFLGKPVKTN